MRTPKHSKAELIRRQLTAHPDLSSRQLAARIGIDDGYVRKTLQRSKLATRYARGLATGGVPVLRTTPIQEADHGSL